MKGPNFRDSCPLSDRLAIENALDDFIERCFKKKLAFKGDFCHWKAEVLRLAQASLRMTSSPSALRLTPSILRYIRFLQRHFVFVPCDKAPSNTVIICKRFYCQVIRNELQMNGVYEPMLLPEPWTAVVQDFVQKTASFGTWCLGPPRLHYLYWLPKMHKPTPTPRFISGGVKSFVTRASTLLTSILQLVLNTLRRKDNARMLAGLPRRYFVVDSFDEVAEFLHRYAKLSPAQCSHDLHTFDFTTLYTSLPQDDLINKVSLVIEEAMEYARTTSRTQRVTRSHGETNIRVFCSRHQSSEWTTSPRRIDDSATSLILTAQDVQSLLGAVVGSTYVRNGHTVFHQHRGLPMGTNSAPLIANLYLYYYEARMVDYLFSLHASLAHSLSLTFRLIDDILSVDCPLFPILLASSPPFSSLPFPFYPSELTLEETTTSSRGQPLARFLGMEIVPDHLSITVYDKRRDFPFATVMYPHAHSNVPANSRYGIFTGQLHRFSRICSSHSDFVANACFVAAKMVNRGYSLSQLTRKFKAFLHIHTPYSQPFSFLLTEFCQRLRISIS